MSSGSTELSNRALSQLSDDIIDHMKRLGDYDDIRVKLIEPIMTDVDFDKIKEKFLSECEQFCEKADLNLNRNALRMKLADHFNSSSRNSSEYMVKAHIRGMLGERDEELRSEYYEKARTFLIKKYSQEPKSSPEIQNEDMILDTDLGSQQVADMEIEDSPDRPTYSPIGSQNSNYSDNLDETKKLQDENDDSMQVSVDEIVDTRPAIDREITINREPIENDEPTVTEPSLDDIPIPPENGSPQEASDSVRIDEFEEIKGDDSTPLEDEVSHQPDDDDELEKLSFSSVSTVHTADLSDFDNSIKLSDDEANIVGRPKNSTVSVDDIKNRIYDLAPNKVECKQEPAEPPEVADHADAVESDGACAESNSSKRATRARKVNPRYSNEDFTHTPYRR